jgi:hypothetical protein
LLLHKGGHVFSCPVIPHGFTKVNIEVKPVPQRRPVFYGTTGSMNYMRDPDRRFWSIPQGIANK